MTPCARGARGTSRPGQRASRRACDASSHTLWIAGFIVLAAFAGGIAVGAQVLIRQQAPTDRAADFPLAELEAIVQEMDAEQRATVRLLEGGSYNVNIRRIRAEKRR